MHCLGNHPTPITYLALEIGVFRYEVSLGVSHEMFDTFDELQPEEGFSMSLQVPVWLYTILPIFYGIYKYPLGIQ